MGCSMDPMGGMSVRCLPACCGRLPWTSCSGLMIVSQPRDLVLRLCVWRALLYQVRGNERFAATYGLETNLQAAVHEGFTRPEFLWERCVHEPLSVVVTADLEDSALGSSHRCVDEQRRREVWVPRRQPYVPHAQRRRCTLADHPGPIGSGSELSMAVYLDHRREGHCEEMCESSHPLCGV
jgi:hypothetical protein